MQYVVAYYTTIEMLTHEICQFREGRQYGEMKAQS